MPTAAMDGLSEALEAQRELLMPCVHCGFCLAVCPTYNRLGDEADSPRGRLHLMGAVVEGRLAPTSEAFRTHIDRCLGCRACEPVCPSGVEYGTLLELARDVATDHAPPALPARVLLGVFRGGVIQSLFFLGGRLMRGSGLASLGARLLPRAGLLGSAKLGLAMLASSGPWKRLQTVGLTPAEASRGSEQAAASKPRGRVALLTGCVQEGLYARINAATVRVLEANGYEVVDVPGQRCCGALHAHSGALDDARGLARVNVAAFGAADVDWVVVNAAGCGAAMKEYGHLIGENEAGEVPEKIRDVTEFLATIELRVGAPVPCSVAVDHPCHLIHAQGIKDEPIEVLRSVPGVEVDVVEQADECCGGAGIYGITHPELGGRIGADKVAAVQRCDADVLATPNPGCMMQIGAGLLMQGSRTGVVHPVEILDESYRRAGFYEEGTP